jgi:hypothetical protein
MEATAVIKTPFIDSKSENVTAEIVNQIMQIGQFSNLPDNWDSYGGKAISYENCARAAQYLYTAYKEFSTDSVPVEMPLIAPSGDGSIVFEWTSDKVELIVIFRPDAQLDVEYLTVEKNGDTEYEKEGVISSVTSFVQAVKWFSLNKA